MLYTMEKKEAIKQALKAIAKYYKKPLQEVEDLYQGSGSVDYVLFRLDKFYHRGK